MTSSGTEPGRRQAVEGLPALGYSAPVVTQHFVRLADAASGDASAAVAVEVPVALVYNGRPHAVMMCTPTDLEDLATGFSVTEGIATPAEIVRTDVVRYGKGVELQIEITAPAVERLGRRGRTLVARTGCGICGVEAIDDALREPAPVRSALTVSDEALWVAGETLGAHQPLNRETSTIHAAAWADAAGTLRVVREDVGRHNALDKVIGALARGGTDAAEGFLVVTSRASYELVQKAAVANVGLLAAVSRPTALAIQLADAAGITLVGLLRGRSANVYTHPTRVVPGGGKR